MLGILRGRGGYTNVHTVNHGHHITSFDQASCSDTSYRISSRVHTQQLPHVLQPTLQQHQQQPPQLQLSPSRLINTQSTNQQPHCKVPKQQVRAFLQKQWQLDQNKRNSFINKYTKNFFKKKHKKNLEKKAQCILRLGVGGP